MRKKNTLYTANKWNRPLFMPEDKNLFDGELSGSNQMINKTRGNSLVIPNQYSLSSNQGLSTTLTLPSSFAPVVWSNNDLRNFTFTANNSIADAMRNNLRHSNVFNRYSAPISSGTPSPSKELTEINPDVPVPSSRRASATNTGLVSTVGNGLTPDDSSVIKASSTLADLGVKTYNAIKGASATSAAAKGAETAAKEAVAEGVEEGAASTAGSGVNTGAIIGAAASVLGNTPMGSSNKNSYWYTKRGGWDMLDPGYNAGRTDNGHLSTKAGDLLGDIGVGAASTGLPYVMLAGAALKSIGNIINNGWGMAANDEKIAKGNQIKSYYNNLRFDANNFDDIASIQTMAMPSGPFTGGVFKKNEAQRKNEEFKQGLLEAKDYAFRNQETNIGNITADMLANYFRNSSAFGGPIETKKDNDMKDNVFDLGGSMFNYPPIYNDMPSINLDLAYRNLATKERNAQNKDQMTNMFMGSPSTMFAIGGDLQTNSADYSTGLTHIDAGGTHELNPNDGVQMGVDNEGTPNLVEEGEAIFNDYVYSNRINLDEASKAVFHFPKKKDITYAEAAKKLEKEIAERPNDPISQAGFKAQMETLAENQERQKQEMEAERAKAAFEALSPEEQTAIMQRAAQEEAIAQQAAMQQEAMAQQGVSPEEAAIAQQQRMQADGSQAMVGQEAPMMAEGGHLFPWGGIKEMFNVAPPYAASNTAGYIPYTRDMTEEEVIKKEDEDLFKAWTQYVNDNWDTTEVQDYLKALDAAAGGNHLFDKNGKMTEKAKEYFNHARTKNHKWGYYHLTPQQIAEEAAKEEIAAKAPRTIGMSYITDDPNAIETTTVDADGNTVIRTPVYEAAKTPEEKVVEEEQKEVAPDKRAGWLRYAGLFGPAVGLGMQAMGIGKPDTSGLDAAVKAANGPVALAEWMPRGDFAVYRPDDPWFYTSPIIAQSNATQRAIVNKVAPSKGAETLANSYNTMIALGNAQRQQLDNNFNKYMKVKDFNGNIYESNAKRFDANSQFNADARNRGRQVAAQIGLQAADQKMDADAGWSNGIYGNVAGLFKGLGDVGRENEEHNMISRMAANGLFGSANPDTPIFKDFLKWKEKRDQKQAKKSKGGKLNKKRGLTF